MRKSKLVALTMLTSTAAMVAACQPAAAPKPQNQVFTSAEQCVSAGGGTKAECDAAIKSAADSRTEHANKEACEAEFGVGKCETKTNSSGGSVFVPAMMGFMMGQMLSGGNRAPAAAFAGSDMRPANSAAKSFTAAGNTVSRGGMATASAGRGGAGA